MGLRTTNFALPWGFCVLLVSVPGVAQQTKQDLLGLAVRQPTYWQAFDWFKANTSSLWVDKRWRPNLSKSGKDDTTHTRKVEAFGLVWAARLREKTVPALDYRISMSVDVPTSKCRTLAEEFGAPYGAPVFSEESMSAGISETASVKLVWQKFQWTAGTTRLDVLCAGNQTSTLEQQIPNKEDSLSLNATFSSTSAADQLQPSILLKCSRSSSMLRGSAETRSQPNLMFWVDISNKMIKDPQFRVISEMNSVSIGDAAIRFSLIIGRFKTRYEIDRLSGVLVGEASEDDVAVLRLNGTCDRITEAKKF